MFPVAVGLSVRKPWVADLLALESRASFDVLEVMIDDALHPRCMADFRRLGSRWPLVAHGVELGIGNAEGLNSDYLQTIAHALEQLHAHWYSEHLCFLAAGDHQLGHFGPMASDAQSLRALERNATQRTRAINLPFLLENPADVLWLDIEVDMHDGRGRGRAFSKSLTSSQAAGLLDITNLLYNARNDGFDPYHFIEGMQQEHIVQIHLAGGREINGLWIDSHDRPVESDALALLRHAARKAVNLRAVTLEWDEDLPAFAVIVEECERIKRVLEREGRR